MPSKPLKRKKHRTGKFDIELDPATIAAVQARAEAEERSVRWMAGRIIREWAGAQGFKEQHAEV